MDVTTSRAGRSPTALAMSLVALTAVATVGLAANPTGKYTDASTSGKVVPRNGASERFSYGDGTVKVTRTKLVIKFNDAAEDEKIRVKLWLRQRVENDDNQTVVVDHGEISIKDRVTGELYAWGGTCNRAKYKVWKSGGTWKVKHRKKLTISGLSGQGPYQGAKVKGAKLEAYRD